MRGLKENSVHGQASHLGWYHKEMDGQSIVLDRLIQRIRVLLFSATYSPSAYVPPYSPTPHSPNPSGGLRSTSATLAPPRSGTVASFGLRQGLRSASAGSTTFPLSPLASLNFPASPLPTAGAFGLSGRDDTGSLPPSSANLNEHRNPGPDYANGADAPSPHWYGLRNIPPSSPNPGGRVPGPVGAKKED